MPTFIPKKVFQLSGSNINFSRKVSFGEEEVESLTYLGTTGISGLVPDAALTSEVTIETNDGILSLGKQNVVLDSDSQVVSSGLLPNYVSGEPGKTIIISGENFHQITNVNFGSGGSGSSEFKVLSDNLIEATVPTDAAYGEITVFSSIRTGSAGNESLASGKTYNKFIPIPSVTGFNSGQIVKGGEFIMGGVALSGVTGITVNDILFDSFVSLGTTGVKATVPTGNVRGVPNLLLESGVTTSAPSDLSFKPLAQAIDISQGVVTGGLVTISGYNFNSGLFYTGEGASAAGGGRTGSLVSIGGETGNFKLISDAGGYNRLEGHVPTSLEIFVSGGNIGVAPTILTHPVSVFSSDYPEEYPSSVEFRPAISPPILTGFVPPSGIGGQVLSLRGNDFYGITGVGFRGGNVGVGTEFSSTVIVGGVPGESVDVIVPDTSSFSTAGGYLSVDVSGFFGSFNPPTQNEGFFVLGTPTVSKVIPDTDVQPGSTGTIYGQRLYSGAKVKLYNGNTAPSNFRADIEVSGYTLAHNEIIFNYPNTFETGNNYKLRVTNDRGSSAINAGAFTSLNAPRFSGSSLVSGEYGDSVTISGYFEGIKPSGLRIGNRIIESFTQASTTGVIFDIPSNTNTNLITVDTSGGYVSSTGTLNVSPKKPSISGFYLGGGDAPSALSTATVFRPSNTLSITGEGMHLVTGVLFSGATNSNKTFVVNNFINQSADIVSFSVPSNINTGSGEFILEDVKGRRTQSSSPVNLVTTSGYTNYVLPGETVNLSGDNVSGLNISFPALSGGYITGVSPVASTIENLSLLSSLTPTGVVGGAFRLSGLGNTDAGNVLSFSPLGVISGVSGFDSSNKVETGNLINVTGFNIPAALEGDLILGISGTGNLDSRKEIHLYEISGAVTGSGIGVHPNTFYSQFSVVPDNSFIGTGQLFLVNSWDNVYSDATYYGSVSETYLTKQVNVFPEEYIITGTRVNVTGFAPERGVTGSNVEISGEGFSAVTGVFFAIPSGANLESDFTINSPNKITALVPTEGIEARGTTIILLSGGTNQDIGEFEVILDASVVEFNIVDEGDTPTSSTRVGNFTQRETINGVVYLVTRTRFPDGTSTVVSSVPEG